MCILGQKYCMSTIASSKFDMRWNREPRSRVPALILSIAKELHCAPGSICRNALKPTFFKQAAHFVPLLSHKPSSANNTAAICKHHVPFVHNDTWLT